VNTREATKQYRLSKWTEIIRECRCSGQTIDVWCTEHGIKPNSYYYWLKSVREAACEALPALNTENSSIVPVNLSRDVTPVHTTGQVSQAEIVLHVGSVMLELHNNATAALIENTLRALQNVR